jgi:hypothetical protein
MDEGNRFSILAIKNKPKHRNPLSPPKSASGAGFVFGGFPTLAG